MSIRVEPKRFNPAVFFVPDEHAVAGFRDRDHLVSQVRVLPAGPDLTLRVEVRGQVAGNLTIPVADEAAMIARLFGDPPAGGGEYFAGLLQELEDAAGAHDVPKVQRLHRAAIAYVRELRMAHPAGFLPSVRDPAASAAPTGEEATS